MGEERAPGVELNGCQPVLGPHAGMRYTRDGQRGREGRGGYWVLRGWWGHRLGTWLVKEQCISLWTCWLSLGGWRDYSAFKTDRSFIPKSLFFPLFFFFVSLKFLWDPDGAVVQRVHGAVRGQDKNARTYEWVNPSGNDCQPLSL